MVDDDVPGDMLLDDMLSVELPVDDIVSVGLVPVVPIELDPADPLGDEGTIWAEAVVAASAVAASAIMSFMVNLPRFC
ncbi:hypothetical protein KZX46_08270 [Polymorphobacter sp. PAMC 29334]|uniref:hypothetical protein n=1 Tax=Polymorphobacter sp. PAMC 29334 TaxID=2862331 RepID=UPI001C763DC6|nr:hypothetical protein [Polymorphobacter sp. PAMC 29334]QYE35925.1 hypothetical protein KZX46_08270 [Polymorphobacter sp. PAMC 29334]